MKQVRAVTWALAGGVLPAMLFAAGLAFSLGAWPPPQRVPDGDSYIRLADGLVTIPDRTLICQVRGQTLHCTNDTVDIICADAVCRPEHLANYVDVNRFFLKDSATRVLPDRTLFTIGQLHCVVHPQFLLCSFPDHLGGFKMDGDFAVNSNYDDAPSDWPWRRRHYGPRDFLPGV